jgi:hypothetical protein
MVYREQLAPLLDSESRNGLQGTAPLLDSESRNDLQGTVSTTSTLAVAELKKIETSFRNQ